MTSITMNSKSRTSASASSLLNIAREAFAATPLSIFITALRSA